MSARVFLRNKYKEVKVFFGYIIFLLSIRKSKFLTKMIYSSQPAKFLPMNLLMHAICYTYLIFIMLSHFLHYQNLSTEITTPFLNCYCYFRSIGPSHMNHPSGNNECDVFKA